MLYLRMFLTMAVTLYTSRVVLNALGVEDYGIYNVVGGAVAMMAFFCLAIEQTADTSFLSGKGQGYCMLIALCLNSNNNLEEEWDEEETEDETEIVST